MGDLGRASLFLMGGLASAAQDDLVSYPRDGGGGLALALYGLLNV
jgi:hypothetical protein